MEKVGVVASKQASCDRSHEKLLSVTSKAALDIIMVYFK